MAKQFIMFRLLKRFAAVSHRFLISSRVFGSSFGVPAFLKRDPVRFMPHLDVTVMMIFMALLGIAGLGFYATRWSTHYDYLGQPTTRRKTFKARILAMLGELGDEYFETASPVDASACVFPRLNPFDPEIMPFVKPLPPLKCPSPPDWVYVQNGTVRFSEAAKKDNSVTCNIMQFDALGSHHRIRGPFVQNVRDGFPLTRDFFTVHCTNGQRQEYTNVHLGVAYKHGLHLRSQETPLPPRAMGGYDVLMLGFDSVSQMAWIRNLPKTLKFFLKELGGIVLEGHNILGDGTVASLMPLLAGHQELDLPSTRKDNPRAMWGVDFYPFIWKELKAAGYVTAWGEDLTNVGTFEMRLTGFKDSPVDHYMRQYLVTAERYYNRKYEYGCLGSELRHVRFFNYFRDMYHMYGAKRKFMFGFHSEFSHDSVNTLQVVDRDLSEFLRNLSVSGYLDHTILILMSDHGSRFNKMRAKQQGKLEERLPFFGLRFPPHFEARYPKEVENVRLNLNRLTTMYDVHEMFHDLLDNDPYRPSRTKGRGISLFKPIPTNRTCSEAGIEPHWCACLKWVNVSNDQALKQSTGLAVVDYINHLTKVARESCKILSLDRVHSLQKYIPQQKVIAFEKSADYHGDTPSFSKRFALDYEYLQVTLVTTPGEGRFEATVKRSVKNGVFQVRSEDISRINRYGNSSSCITKKFPSLRPFCYCSIREDGNLNP